ncbi:hypothetical protein D1Y84_02615 [Acidipila sp. EB88]|nr:hypothetical protein D1Y84_02615 [Acidipila sp. EB88]
MRAFGNGMGACARQLVGRATQGRITAAAVASTSRCALAQKAWQSARGALLVSSDPLFRWSADFVRSTPA